MKEIETMIRKLTRIDSKIEFRITTACIVSKEFLRGFVPIYKHDFIASDYLRKIVNWCIDYHKKYEESPNTHIKDIFESHKEYLEESEAELIAIFIEKMSDDFDQNIFNYQYILDKTIEYFKKRSLEILQKDIKRSIDRDDPEGAEDILNGYRKVEKELSGWYNPFDEKNIDDLFANEDKDKLFKLPGIVGDFIGDFERGNVYTIFAPPKRGKTTWSQRIAMQGLYSQLKVAFFCMEMNKNKMDMRILKEITGLVERAGEYPYPVFDCLSNQNCSCRKSFRPDNKKMVVDRDNKICVDYKNIKHIPCTKCRGKSVDFIPTSWHVSINCEKLDADKSKKRIKKLERWRKANLRLKVYPKYRATMDDIKRDLDTLENVHDFIPDLIIMDSLQTMRGGNLDERHNLDRLFREASGIASERHCALINAHQGNQESMKNKNMRETDISEAIIQILANIDGGIFLNQTPNEKKNGIMRISCFKRHEDFDITKKVAVLQNFSYGRVIIDSEYHREAKKSMF